MNATFKCQFAIRNSIEGVHVQLVSSKDLFHNGYTRDYGAAFNVKNSQLTAAVAKGEKTLNSLAGSGRRYVAGTVTIDGDTMRFVLKGEGEKAPKIFAAAHKSVETVVTVLDSQIS